MQYRGPELVALVVQVQAVGAEKLGPRLSVGGEHRLEDVDIDQTLVERDELFDGRVRLANKIDQRAAHDAGFDGQIGDAGFGKGGLHLGSELLEVGEHLLGFLARSQIVVTGVQHNQPWPIGDHDSIDEMDGVG